MFQRGTLAACAAMLSVMVCSAYGAELTTDQYKCQKTVATQGRVFFKKRLKALGKCHNKINAGDLPLSTDCTVESKTQGKLDGAAQKLADKITAACSDSVVASLSFGGQCSGVTTGAALASCEQAEHEAASDTLIATVYGDSAPLSVCVGGADAGVVCTDNMGCDSMECAVYQSAHTCVGGTNDGAACTDDAGCSGGACATSDEQQTCTEALVKALGKLADKRLKTEQGCKKKVAKGKLDLTTDCVAEGQAKIDEAFAKTLATILADCPSSVTATLGFGGACTSQVEQNAVAACGTCTVAKQVDELTLVEHGSSARGGSALAKQITDTADCVGGPLSRCRANDYLLANDRIRVVVQDVQRNMFGIGQFGGQIIDGDIVRAVSDPDRDNFEEWSLSLNIESTGHYTSVTVLNDGSDGGPAIVRATGVDDLLDFVNPSSVIANFNVALPASADDVDLPVTVTTDYILEPATNYVRVETSVQNTDIAQRKIFFGDYINGSGLVEMFQPGYGFGEPLISTTCPVTPQNLCNFTAYMGVDDGAGVSYGYIQQTRGSSTFTTSGVHVPQLGVEVLLALLGAAVPPYTLAPAGDAGDILTLTRYFVVGGGNVSDVSDARNEIQCLPTGTLQGTVTAGGSPTAGVNVVVLGDTADGPQTLFGTPLPFNPVTHTKTDAQGKYSVTLPPGDYNVIANFEGSPYEGSASDPAQHPVTVAAFGSLTQDIALPATGAVQVTVVDENNVAIAAKAMVVGKDPSTDPLNFQSAAFGKAALFRDRTKDFMPYGIARSIFIDTTGDSGVVPLEPGSYQVVVSHGPDYSIDTANITVTAGMTSPVAAKVERVVDSSGFVASDFHVHSLDSPDSRVTHHDRVLTMLDEGMDFFTPTDHDFRTTDYQTTIDDMGATDLLGTAVGEEITSFDYGHLNAWPLVTDANQVNHGATDFGGAAPDGMDYPSSMNYSHTPAEIIALAHADAPGASNTVQINHIHSHFGLDGGSGLAIDTALTPPASTVPAQARRLDPLITNFFTNAPAAPATEKFNALEIWIGDDRGQIFNLFLGQNIGDWFNMINQGILSTGVADSDTHTRTPGTSGFPRTMVASPSDDPGDLSGLADTLSANVNSGHAFGTNGPMVRVSVEAASTSQEASLEDGEPTTICTTDGAVDINVDIQSPTWIEFDKVEYYINTTTTRFVLNNKRTGYGPPIDVNRYSITPDYTQTAPADFTINTVPVAGTTSSRFEASTTLSLASLTEDIWVVVLVKGTDGVSKPLFPVLPNSLDQIANDDTVLADLTDGNLGEGGITALAFTNPLFVDVDPACGGWTAPGVQVNP